MAFDTKTKGLSFKGKEYVMVKETGGKEIRGRKKII